jgi:hypothetical protein
MLDEYYFYRGCSDMGIPTRRRLMEVGLMELIDDLQKRLTLEEGESPAITELVV